MARMLGAARPGHKGTCVGARRGCTCYLLPGEHGQKAKKLRRRARRHAEARDLRR